MRWGAEYRGGGRLAERVGCWGLCGSTRSFGDFGPAHHERGGARQGGDPRTVSEAWVLGVLWFDTAFRQTPGRLTTNGGRVGATGSLRFSENGVAGSAGIVGCCWVPAGDAGMAEGRRVGCCIWGWFDTVRWVHRPGSPRTGWGAGTELRTELASSRLLRRRRGSSGPGGSWLGLPGFRRG